jgi:hypothetical protein
LAQGIEKSTKATAEFSNQMKRVGVGDASGGLDHNGAGDTLVEKDAHDRTCLEGAIGASRFIASRDRPRS